MEKAASRRGSPRRQCVLPTVSSQDKVGRPGQGESGVWQQASGVARCPEAPARLAACPSPVGQGDLFVGKGKIPPLSIRSSSSGAFGSRDGVDGHNTAATPSVLHPRPPTFSPELAADHPEAAEGQFSNCYRHRPSRSPLSPLTLCLRRGFSSPPFIQIQTGDTGGAWRLFLKRQPYRFPEDSSEWYGQTDRQVTARQSPVASLPSRVSSWCYGTPVSSAGAPCRMAASAPCSFSNDSRYSTTPHRSVGLFRNFGTQDSLYLGGDVSSPSPSICRQRRTGSGKSHLKKMKAEQWGFLCGSPRTPLYALGPFSTSSHPLAAERTSVPGAASRTTDMADRNPFVYRPPAVSSSAGRRRRRKASLLVCPLPPPPSVLAKSVEPWQHRPSWFIHTHPHFRQSRLQRLALLLLTVRTQIMLPLRALGRALQVRGASRCISVISSLASSHKHHVVWAGQAATSRKSSSPLRWGTSGSGSRRGSVSSVSSLSREDKHARVSGRVARSVKRQLLSHRTRWSSPDNTSSLDAVDSAHVVPAAFEDTAGPVNDSCIHYTVADKADSPSCTTLPSPPLDGTSHSEQTVSAGAEDSHSSPHRLPWTALFPVVFLLNVVGALTADSPYLSEITSALLRLQWLTKRFCSRVYKRLKFCILLVTMYPFVHGCYLPGLAVIWFISRIREGCWWLYVNRCLGYRTSEQLHQEKMQRLWQLQNRLQSTTADGSATFGLRGSPGTVLRRLVHQRAGSPFSREWLQGLRPVWPIVALISTVISTGLRLLLIPARPFLVVLAFFRWWKQSAGLAVVRFLRRCANAVPTAAELALSIAAAITALIATDAHLVREVDKVTAAEAVEAALPEGSVYTTARPRKTALQAVARPEDMVNRLWRVGDGSWITWPWRSSLTAGPEAPCRVGHDQQTEAVDSQRSGSGGSRRPRRTEVFEVLTGQELMMFSQPLMIVSGVGYTDHLTLPDLVEVVETRLLGMKAPKNGEVPVSCVGGSPDPLTAFKHPRLRTVVGKLFGRYCWVRAEDFDVHNHVFRLNKHEVLSLLRHHRQKLDQRHQEVPRPEEEEQTREEDETVSFYSGSERGEDVRERALCAGGDDCKCVISSAEAQALENALATQALQPSVPLWQFVLLEHVELPRVDEEGHADEEPFSDECVRNEGAATRLTVGSMVMFRIHHAIADGIAITNMFLSDLLSAPCGSGATDMQLGDQRRGNLGVSTVAVAELDPLEETIDNVSGDDSSTLHSSTHDSVSPNKEEDSRTSQLSPRREGASLETQKLDEGTLSAFSQGILQKSSASAGGGTSEACLKEPSSELQLEATTRTRDERQPIKSLVPPLPRPSSVLARLFMQLVSYLHVPFTVASLLMLTEEKSWDCPEKPRPQRSGRICVLPPIRFRLKHLKHLRRALATIPGQDRENTQRWDGTTDDVASRTSRLHRWRQGLRNRSLRDVFLRCAESVHSVLGSGCPRRRRLQGKRAGPGEASLKLSASNKKADDRSDGQGAGFDAALPKSALFTINELLAACLVGGISRYVHKKVTAKFSRSETIHARVSAPGALETEPFRAAPLHGCQAEYSGLKDQERGTGLAYTRQEALRYSESMGSLSSYSSSTCSTTTSSRSSGSACPDCVTAGFAGHWNGQLASRSPTSCCYQDTSGPSTPQVSCKIAHSHAGEARIPYSSAAFSERTTASKEGPSGRGIGTGDCTFDPKLTDFFGKRAALLRRGDSNALQPSLQGAALLNETKGFAADAQQPTEMAQMELDMLEHLIPQLNIVVPVNLRTTEEQSFELRNNFTSSVVQVAAQDVFKAPSAYARLVGVRKSLRRSVRSLGALVFAFMEKVSFCTTPDFLLFLQIWLTKKVSLLFSNVPGPSELPHIHGRRVHAMHFIGPLAGRIGLIVSAFSYADHLDLVITADKGILESPELLRQCILEEYSELKQMCPPVVG
ncbi:ws dgat mgat [Cystoisospora suis]|uniref:Ws dgat mgat n=1 Tax=Cystoisospora suis TaxID=483139 RepID=A0A2C6L7U3_9APIC|nr:ws dgat mgat [Cystoisospora suis]